MRSETENPMHGSAPKQVPLLREDTVRRWQDSQRPERPAELNSAALSVLQMTNSMIGSGILSFPYVFTQTGLVTGILLLLLFASMVYVTCVMLLETGRAVGTPTGDQSEILKAALGVSWSRTIDLCFTLMANGSLLSYFNVIGLLGAKLTKSTRPPFLGFNTYPSIMIICTLVLSPFCFFRAYGELTPISAVALALITVTTLVVAVKGAVAGETIPLWPASWHAPLAVTGNYAYALTLQYVVHEMYASMKATDRPAGGRVIFCSLSCGFTLLLVMGLGGIAAIGKDVETNVLSSFNPAIGVTKLLYVLTIVHIMAYIPNDFVIGRLFFFRYFDINPLRIPTTRYVVITAVLLAAPLALMASIPRALVLGAFELVIDLTGEIPITIGCFIAPVLAFKRTCMTPEATEKRSKEGDLVGLPLIYRPWVADTILAINLLVLFLAPAATLYEFIDTCLTKSCKEFS